MDTSDIAKERGARGPFVPGILIAVAGVCGILSYALGWARMTYPTSEPSLATAPAGHPRLGLFLGVFMVVAGVVIVVAKSREAARAWGTFGVACGLVMGAVAVLDLVHERDRAVSALVNQSVRGSGPPADALRAQLRALVDFSFRPGVYLALVAAVLSLVAAVMFLRQRPAGVEAPSTEPPEGTDETSNA